MVAAYGLLCNDPWHYRPEEVGRLTDWQIMELVIGPAVRRSRRNRGLTEPTEPRGRRGRRKEKRGPLAGLPSREAFIRGGVEVFGGDPEKLAAEYDEAVAAVMREHNGHGT